MKALLGGSFDPIHLGHVDIARQLLAHYPFSDLYFVPAFQNPLKGGPLATASQRTEMVNLALSETNEARFHVLDWEATRLERSYTVETLKRFVQSEGPVTLLLGNEVFAEFDRWKDPQRILELANVVVFSRAGQVDPRPDIFKKLGLSSQLQAKVEWLRLNVLPFSATEIRRQLAQKTKPPGLSPLVQRFIKNQGLYSEE